LLVNVTEEGDVSQNGYIVYRTPTQTRKTVCRMHVTHPWIYNVISHLGPNLLDTIQCCLL